MQISVVRPAELGPAEITAWHRMQHSVVSLASPFLSPELTVAAGHVRPRTRVAVLEDGTQVAGFFPFERRPLGLGVPVAAGLTDCQGLVHGPGVDWDARELLRACGLAVWRFDHLTSGQRSFERYATALAHSPVIDLTAGYDTYAGRLRARSPGFVSVIARKARKLRREVGEIRFEADSADASALRLLMAWKSAQYRKTGRPDRFAEAWVVGLLEVLAATRGPDFSGQLSVLYAGGAPVAAHFGLRAGSVLAYWFPAYDPAFSRYSPGLITLLQLASTGAASGIGLIDLGKGAMRYKEDAKTGDLLVGEGVVTRLSPLAAMHRAHVAGMQRALRTVRGNQRLFGLADRMLRGYGRSRGLTPMPPAGLELPVAAPPPGREWPGAPPPAALSSD